MSVYTETVRDALAELSDAEYQRRVWMGRGAANEMSSFDESVERLFGDSGLSIALDRGGVYGSHVDDELRRLHALVGRIDGARSPAEILLDPLLGPVRELAQRSSTRWTSGLVQGVFPHARAGQARRPPAVV